MAANHNSNGQLLTPRSPAASLGQTRTGSSPPAGAIVERVSHPPAESDIEQHGERTDTLGVDLPVHAGTVELRLPPLDAQSDRVLPRTWCSC
jgi:hypothetical protein